MRYEKPTVMDLGAGARSTVGQEPLVCISGSAAGGQFESCASGGAAQYACKTGGAPFPAADICVGGINPGSANDCASGSGVTGYCIVGPTNSQDPRGCNVGPSYI
jgi:hypothetical protein